MNLALAITEPVHFTEDDVIRAHEAWGANCGPGALAAVTGLMLETVRAHLIGFDLKRYTNPTMMLGALRSLRVPWRTLVAPPATKTDVWPDDALVRIQWEGPWTQPGVPIAARYRQTHWVASRHRAGRREVFDINCMQVGGWVGLDEWRTRVVPWILRDVRRASGGWHQTHVLVLFSGKDATP